MGNIVEDADHAKHQPIAVEYLAPFGEVLAGKNLVEDLYQFQRSRMAVRPGGKPRIGDNILPPHAARQRRPLPVLVEQREDKPAAVLAPVVVGHRIQRALARAAFLEFGAA